MSLEYQKIKPVLVEDPRVRVLSEKDYAVLKSGSQCTWKAWTSTSVSTNSIQFSCPPPSGGVYVDNKCYLVLPVRLTFTGTPGVGNRLLVDDRDAPRAWPINGSIDTLSATINNQSVSINPADIIHALQHYNSDVKMKNGGWSTTPNCPDQTQQYTDMDGAVRNPLNSYDNGSHQAVSSRGSYPFTIVSNPVGAGAAVTAVVDACFCEPIILPPFYAGHGQRAAFFNVNSMDFNFTFLTNLANRMWSHDATSAGSVAIATSSVAFGGNIGGPATTFAMGGVPQLLIQYITPNESTIISPNQPLVYPYFDIQRYPSQLGSYVAGASDTVNSNNIQLSSIPRKMYIYIRDSNQSLYNTTAHTDTFCSISNISIQFANKNGLLASANSAQLYEMSVKNGLNMSWMQYSGEAMNVGYPDVIRGIGSVVCVEFGTDICLGDLEAPGKLGQYQLQVQVGFKNISSRTMSPTLYIVTVLEGTFSIPTLGRAAVSVGVLSSQDVLDAKEKPGITYDDLEGGDFLSGIKDFAKTAWDSFRKNPISNVLQFVPGGEPFAKMAKTVGWGEGVLAGDGRMRQQYAGDGVLAGVSAGEGLLGGRQMTRKQLEQRLKKY